MMNDSTATTSATATAAATTATYINPGPTSTSTSRGTMTTFSKPTAAGGDIESHTPNSNGWYVSTQNGGCPNCNGSNGTKDTTTTDTRHRRSFLDSTTQDMKQSHSRNRKSRRGPNGRDAGHTTNTADNTDRYSSKHHTIRSHTVSCRKTIHSRISILLVSILIFATILSAGLVLINVVARSNTNSNRVDVERLAVETGQFFANELDKATLPLFSLAQFATELDLFNDLPSQIGQAGETGALPFLNGTFVNGTFANGRIRRNTTGVCDQPDLVAKFNKIAQTATNNAKLGDVLHNVQFAPFGVICLSSPLVYVDSVDGTVLNNSVAIGVDLLNTPQQQYLARETLKGESINIVGPRTIVQCPECGFYFIVRIPIVSMTDSIEIDGQEYSRWGFATALIQWEKLVHRSKIYDQFSSENKDFQLTRTDRIYNETTNVYDEVVVTLAQSEHYDPERSRNEIEHNLQTTNNEWKIVIQYADNNSWKGWTTAICIVVALCISWLTYVTLVQKQNHSVMKGVTLVQEAKVDIERNMTAYFAHELRNPLCAIDCALLAMPDDLPLETRELVVGMTLCSTFMSSIMNNLLDVRKMEEGKLIMRYEPFSLSKLVANIHAMILPTVKANVELIQIAETENRDWVLGDIHRLEQIMYNLVSNSIKYTKIGSITIYAGWDDAGNVRLECRDTGPGIPKEEQENLFERFIQRGDAPGSGLGLAIAKKLVTLMGGSIWFDSDPTQRPGTNCIAEIPLRTCDAPVEIDDQAKEVAPIEEPISILIVDDITINRNMLRRRFEKCIAPNCVIQEVTTGEESLTVCGQDGKSFDVIIMDQYMNEAGGVMVGTDTIIALRRMNVQSYIIGCSGNDLDERFYTAGANLIWKKPLPSNTEIIQQLQAALVR